MSDQAPRKTEVKTQYPANADELFSVFSNHVNIRYLPEEVYLDFCTIQIQDVDEKEVDDQEPLTSVPAKAHTRVVISRAHATRLGIVLLQSLCSEEQRSRLAEIFTQPGGDK